MTVSAGVAGSSSSPLVELTPLPSLHTNNTEADR